MKKFYSYLTLLLGVLAFALPQKAMAQASTEDIDLTFCIMVDDPSLCYVMDENNVRTDLVAGENLFTLKLHKTTYSDGSFTSYSDYLAFIVEDSKQNDYRITACDVEIGGERRPYSGFWGPTTRLSISLDSEEMDGCTFYPVISNLSDMRTATATLTVDDASKVQVRCGNNGYMPELSDGDNTISFDPVNESNWTIGAKEYGEYLGGVTHNGEKVEEQYGGLFYLTVAQGDVIVVNTEVDNTPVAVSFSLASTDAEAAVKSVEIYNSSTYSRDAVDNWKEGFTVAPRTQLIVTLDKSNYNVKSFAINGEEQTLWSNEVYITVTESTVIAVDAEKYSTFSLDLTITDPAHVSVGVAESQWSETTVLEGLVVGKQTVEISEKCTVLVVKNKNGYTIDKVAYVINGEETDLGAGRTAYYVPLEGATAVTIESRELVREDVGILWINDIEKLGMIYLEGNDGTTYFHTYAEETGAQMPVTGDQAFNFDANADNPFTLFFSPLNYDTPGYVTVNDEMVYPKYQGSTTYELNIHNGDIIRVYAGEEAPSGSYAVTFNVDAADRLFFETTDWETWETTKTVFPAGETTLTFDEPVYLSFEVEDGFGVKSFVNRTTGDVIYPEYGSYQVNLTPANNGHVFDIVTYNEEDARTAEMPIWVDNASKVAIYYAATYKKAQDLVDGDNVFKYNPDTETSIRIQEANYGTLYKVLVNGVPAEEEWGAYIVECSPENKVEIYANFPDVEVPVTFTFTNEGTEAALANVTVNGTFVEDFLNGITVKMGDKLTFDLNGADYNVTEVTLNGEPVDYYEWTVVDEKMDFVITAEKHKAIPFTLNINDPKAVTIYKGEIWYDIKYTDLVAGENQLEVSTASTTIVVKANSGAQVNSVMQNGDDIFPGWDGNYVITIAENDVITIDAQSAQRTAKAIVWVDDTSKATWLCGMSRQDDSAYDDADGILVTGENEVVFDPAQDNPFSLSFAGPAIADGSVKVFVNDSPESLVPDFNNYFSGIVLSDGDYIKVYINAPETAITTVNAAPERKQIFTLQGAEVKTPGKGLYIINGQKVVIK